MASLRFLVCLLILASSCFSFAGHPDEDSVVAALQKAFLKAQVPDKVDDLALGANWTCTRYYAEKGDNSVYDVPNHLNFEKSKSVDTVLNSGDNYMREFVFGKEALSAADEQMQFKFNLRINENKELIGEWLIGPMWVLDPSNYAPGILDETMYTHLLVKCHQ